MKMGGVIDKKTGFRIWVDWECALISIPTTFVLIPLICKLLILLTKWLQKVLFKLLPM